MNVAQLEAALQMLFHQLLNREEVTGSLMARPIAPDVSATQITTLFARPGALLWELTAIKIQVSPQNAKRMDGV
jgi:hypothetical protein